MTFLKIESVSKTYPNAKRSCLEGLDLEVEEGETVVILGHSGCGKTTLLKIIAGLEDCDSGTVSLNGDVINGIPPYDRPISMVFQKPYLFKNMTVFGNISFAPKIRGMFGSKEEMVSETQRYIDLVKLTGLEERISTQLSGGQEQRVSLARALILKPKLLLLDEPLSALDAGLRVEMRESIRSICKELGQTVIFVTHDQEEAVALADRIALLADGKIVQCARPSEFYNHPATKGVARFFGWKNVVPCIYESGIAKTDFGEFATGCSGSNDSDKVMVIRPEAFVKNKTGKIRCEVVSTSFMGSRVDYTLSASGVTLYASMPVKTIHNPGDVFNADITEGGYWVVDNEPDPEPEMVKEKKTLKSLIKSMFRK